MELMIWLILLSTLGSSTASLNAHKAGVLVALKRSLLGLGNTSDWTVENSDRACTDWKGVICNSDDSEVVELHLAGNGFTGEISSVALGQLASLRVLDVSKNLLVGSLPAELGLLQSLQALDVSGNRLTGSLPRDLGNCSALRFLNAQQNQLQGPIPPQLGALQRLEILVHNNRLSGSLPPSLANCSKLQEIWLTSNDVEGEIPQEVGAMQELRVFFVERNRLEGLIPPVFANCSSLELLALGENSLGGRIPDELGRLENLVALSLHSVQRLEGPIPPEISNNSKLEWFDINGNSLMHGSIPVSLLQLPRLATLQLSYFNNTSDRPVPEQLWNMTQLEFLGIGRTNSRGILSSIVGNLTRLRSLRLNGNRFEGSVPDELSKCTRMEMLILSNNRLLGGVTRSLGTLQRLRVLMLGGNQLSGAIPEELGNCTNLEELVLERNFFRGAIPESIARMAKLRSLLLYGNQLSGVIPAPASPEIIDMRLHGNSLSGSIPPSVGNLSKLSILYLSNNKLDGSIPATLGQLRRLTRVDFSENQLTGGIPGSLASCDTLQLLDLSSNLLSGEIPASIGEWTGFDLSANQLTGEIPTSLGKLAGVRELNLSHNWLSGGIPWTLGEMTSMAVLDLSFNRINGTIPGGLARLHLLKDLRVVFNDLEGRIPETLEFGASSYEGNPGLCGEPLSRPCEGDGLVDVGDGVTWWKENVSNGAFVVGFLGGFFTFLIEYEVLRGSVFEELSVAYVLLGAMPNSMLKLFQWNLKARMNQLPWQMIQLTQKQLGILHSSSMQIAVCCYEKFELDGLGSFAMAIGSSGFQVLKHLLAAQAGQAQQTMQAVHLCALLSASTQQGMCVFLLEFHHAERLHSLFQRKEHKSSEQDFGNEQLQWCGQRHRQGSSGQGFAGMDGKQGCGRAWRGFAFITYKSVEAPRKAIDDPNKTIG
ncbi:LRR receptor-like serine/threonine-protein kinase GSO1, partial [Selaginella moellendorffii]|uniref:LRR receptor-like serine/threonine-protein kinase GSO1 n=1 Tax=Selaginella moellendorffii TaxID=88036 RepID=UPI000D1C353D